MTDSEGKHPRGFYVLILSTITVFLAFETTWPILPLYITESGATIFELGLIIGILSVTLMLTKMPLAILAGRVRTRTIIIGCSILQSACQLSYSLAPALIWFYPIRILHGLSIAPFIPLGIGMMAEFAPKGKIGETMGTFLTSYGIANTLGPFLCASLLTVLSYTQIFQLVSIIPIIGILPFITGVRFPRLDNSLINTASPIQTLSFIFHSRGLRILTALRLCFAITIGIFITYFVVYAEGKLLFAPFLIAFLLGVRGAADMCLRIPVGRLIDKVDCKIFILIGVITLAVVYFLLSFVTDLYLLIGIMFLYGASLSLRVVAEWTMVAKNSSSNMRNLTAAYLSTIYYIGSGIGAILGGALATFLEIPFLFTISSIILMFSIVFALLIRGKDSELLENEETKLGGVIDGRH